MIHFGAISQQEFLTNYWQKKPLLIKQALPDFISPITADELAGLSLENEFESRLVQGNITTQQWSLNSGPFTENTFTSLSEKDWTLLVQGVDRFMPEVGSLISHFDFIPRWRFDDVMISYAAKGGSVGPHFDYYDVFLLQGSGKRRWDLSTKHCNINNYLKNAALRIMQKFEVEQSFEVEAGDVLYIPPKVAHHGVSLDDDCTTLSFGYRSYSCKEMFDESCPTDKQNIYYQDPVWNDSAAPALIPNSALKMANKIAHIDAISFAKFVTKLDTLDQQIFQQLEYQQYGFEFNPKAIYQLHSVCKVAYIKINNKMHFFINGSSASTLDTDEQSLINFCNQRLVNAATNPSLSQQLFNLNLVQEV
ncbi:cupin domain-containing protein [Candidatus Thioglobus sp.]|uniref:cupin domain-containing protein n=1 Tax=Candidatus Thioglobus sp. TaxID=2026721 RepID=UPI003D0D408C